MFPEGENVWMANIWQGEWPHRNTEADGFFTTAPVKRFAPNGYGLHDMAGNVWEIVADLYHPTAYELPSATAANSTGPSLAEAREAGMEITSHVTKGGSFLCSDVWCKGYQPGSRGQIDIESPANHTGFRCVKEVE
jgi:formylglycine-generating enzyme required for sulfatase activity